MVEEIIFLSASIGITLFCFGLFSEYHFFIIIGIFLCCASMFCEEIFFK